MLVGWLVLLFWPAPGGGAGLVLPFVNGASPSLVQHEMLRPAPPGSAVSKLRPASPGSVVCHAQDVFVRGNLTWLILSATLRAELG